MLASVLGVALSIQFGIAATYALGVVLYAVCVLMLAVRRKETDLALPVVEQGPALVPDVVAGPVKPSAPAPQTRVNA